MSESHGLVSCHSSRSKSQGVHRSGELYSEVKARARTQGGAGHENASSRSDSTRSHCDLLAARTKSSLHLMEVRNLSWHVLLGELRVGAIDHSNLAIAGPLRSIFRIASDELEHEVELPIRTSSFERGCVLLKLRMRVLRRLWESATLGKLASRCCKGSIRG